LRKSFRAARAITSLNSRQDLHARIKKGHDPPEALVKQEAEYTPIDAPAADKAEAGTDLAVRVIAAFGHDGVETRNDEVD
jgi:hypothetical protein